MTRITRLGALLLIAIALGFGAIPAVQAQDSADLALEKVLFQTGEPLFAGDQVSWNLTLTNEGPAAATNIKVAEDFSGLGDFTLDSSEAGEGTTFDGTEWSIPALAAGEYTTLNLTTTINGNGQLTNSASITASDQEDLVTANNQASATTGVGASITAEIEVKPETINLGSRGVFTVFITFDGDYSMDAIDLEASSLFCNGIEAKKLHVNQKNGGTLMAKFPRLDLNVPEPDAEAGNDAGTSDEADDDEDIGDQAPEGEKTLTITCEGTIQFGEETVEVSGTDTVRVTGEKKKGLDALFARFLDKVLPLDDETEDEAIEETGTSTGTPTPGKKPTLNPGQEKKGNGDGVCTGDCSAAPTPGSQGNGKKSGTPDDDSVTGSQANGKKGGTSDDTVTGSQGNGNQGNADGQGNSNKPEKEKGNGRK